MKIDINKKYTWCGRPAIIHATNGPDATFPIVASIMKDSGGWITDCYKPDSFEEVREPREWTLCGNPSGAGCIVEDGPSLKCEDRIRVREIID